MDLTAWLETAATSARTIATGPLGMAEVRWEPLLGADVPADLCGVYIPLLAKDYALQFGILGRHDVCMTLGKSLLGMGPDESLADDSEMFDAVGEVTNMVAGGIKAMLAGQADVNLGLPLALTGKVYPAVGSVRAQGIMRMNEHEVWLVMSGCPL
jgi:chemotaxis phosphatase CheX-like protein